ncbi:ABC transporter permease subunit [Mangrovivirga sp. M17]|uniref:ABC transporter permease subunit n=1 Tax=Mangrovivirga halotolerans TaxID=2993936 RepID=A0ABT3RPB4_9BACT|nr:ABC transporter permease subunit [Mangrovivirga halotolerans]MCX2743461.1 ABC transporter permease subunit [Mangrovivirga halotolerans]
MKKKILISFFLVITVVPVLAGLIYAFLYSLGITGVISKGLTFSYWKEILYSSGFFLSLFYSLIIGAITIFISFFIAYFIYPFFINGSGKGQLIMFIPLSIPPMVWAFYHYLMFSGAGFISRLSYHLGLISNPGEFPVLVNDNFGTIVILTHVVMAFPFFTLYFIRIHNSEKIDRLTTLAKNFGASDSEVSWRVRLPIIFLKSRVLLILYLVFVAGSYEVPLLLGSQSPRMITVFTLEKMQRFDLYDKPVAYGAAFLYAIVVLIIVLFSLKRSFRTDEGRV